MPASRTFYERLEVPENATQEQIKQAHRELITELHPDRFSPSYREEIGKLAAEVNEAYQTLSSTRSRGRYDTKLRQAREKGEPPPTAEDVAEETPPEPPPQPDPEPEEEPEPEPEQGSRQDAPEPPEDEAEGYSTPPPRQSRRGVNWDADQDVEEEVFYEPPTPPTRRSSANTTRTTGGLLEKADDFYSELPTYAHVAGGAFGAGIAYTVAATAAMQIGGMFYWFLLAIVTPVAAGIFAFRNHHHGGNDLHTHVGIAIALSPVVAILAAAAGVLGTVAAAAGLAYLALAAAAVAHRRQ